jgi:ActR/RegA family two-component response regulator
MVAMLSAGKGKGCSGHHDNGTHDESRAPRTAGGVVKASLGVVIGDTCMGTVNLLRDACLERSFRVRSCSSGAELRKLVEQFDTDLVITEVRLSDGHTIKHLAWIKESCPRTRVVIATRYGSVATAVQCSKLRAHGYLEKPVALDDILVAAYGEQPIDEAIHPQPLSLTRALWEYINHAVELGGSLSAGANLLGLDRRSLRRMLTKYAPPMNSSIAPRPDAIPMQRSRTK